MVKNIDEDEVDFIALHLYKKHKIYCGILSVFIGRSACFASGWVTKNLSTV